MGMDFTPRVDFKPAQFDEFIESKGYTAIWEQAMFCSCYNLESGQPQFDCPACYGKGYIYLNPTKIKVAVAGISGQKEQERQGLLETGHAYLTSKTIHEIGYRDKFTFLDFNTKFSEILVRGEDRLKFSCKQLLVVRQINNLYKIEEDVLVKPEDNKQVIWNSADPQEGVNYSVLYITYPVYIVTNVIHEIRGTYIRGAGGLDYFAPLPKQFKIKRDNFTT